MLNLRIGAGVNGYVNVEPQYIHTYIHIHTYLRKIRRTDLE